jgi:hypothetical protein
MQTLIIPVIGDGLVHISKLAELDAILTSPPTRLLVKLIGPGGLSAETALAYVDLLVALPADCATAVVSYADLGVPEFAVFLAVGPLREIRPSARVLVPHPADHEPEVGNLLCTGRESPFTRGAYRQCLALIERHVSLRDVVGRHLGPQDLADLLVVASARTDGVLALAVGGETGVLVETVEVAR